MTPRAQKLCGWSGLVHLATCLVGGIVFCRWLPPPLPSWSAQRIAETYTTRATMIQIGLIIVIFGVTFMAPLEAAISVQMKRIEGRRSPWTYTQLMLGTCLIMEFIVPLAAMQIGTFRPGRSAELIVLLNDFGWITFIGVTGTAVVQAVAIGMVLLQDRRPQPLFPRWVGYLNYGVALGFLPGTVTVFFKTGLLAWGGILSFWIPWAVYFVWVGVLSVVLIRTAGSPDLDDESRALGDGSQGSLDAQALRIAAMERDIAGLKRSRVATTSGVLVE